MTELLFAQEQEVYNPLVHHSHLPQAILKAATTRSPGLTFVTLWPIFSTVPINS